MKKEKPILLPKESQELHAIHKRISFALFSNLPRYVRLNRMAEDLGMNWRTVKNHIDLMCEGYKERSKIGEIKSPSKLKSKDKP